MSIRAVIFDLDNTLTHRDLTVQAYTRYLTQHFSEQLLPQQEQQLLAIIRRIDRGGYPIKEQLTHGSIGASVAYAMQQELTWHQVPDLDVLTAFWFEKFGACAVAMPQLYAMLNQLRSEGYRLGIISNGGHETRLKIIQGLDVEHYFEHIVSSGSFGLSKPQPEIFQYTVAQFGLKPQQCVYVGDHPINDIEGANHAGLHSIWIEGFHATTQNIQPKIQQLNDLFPILDALNQQIE